MDEQIKPVAFGIPGYAAVFSAAQKEYGLCPGANEPLYDQQAIDTLRTEVEDSEGAARVWRRRCQEAEARAERAEAELEALRKDAERYRWLRAIDDDAPPDGDGYPALTQWKHVVSDRHKGTLLFGSALDAAIDAAKQGAE